MGGRSYHRIFRSTWHFVFIHKDHDFPMRIRLLNLHLSSRPPCHYTTDFLEFRSLPILTTNLWKFPYLLKRKKKSLSLLLLAKKKRWNLTTLFVPRGLYPADRGIGRQSNCVAIRRVAFERGEEKSGAGEWKGWTVYSEKGGRRERERGRVKVARGRHGRARVLFGLWRE